MLRAVVCGWWIVAAMVGVCGCDQAPPPPTATPSAAQPEERDPRPTTQQFLDTPRDRICLGDYPLTIEVPRTWRLQRLQTSYSRESSLGRTSITDTRLPEVIYILQGPIPSGFLPTGDVQIQISRMLAIPAGRMELLVADARRLLEREPNRYKHVEVRNDGPLYLIEKRWVEPAKQGLDDVGRPMQLPERIGWERTLYVPRENEFVPYRLSILLLTAEQYARDGKLLEPIMASVRYEAALEPIDTVRPR